MALQPDDGFLVGIAPPDDFLSVEDVLGGPYKRAVGLAWSPDGSLLAAGCGEGICLWSMPEKEFSLFGQEPGHSVRALAFSPDGQRLASVAWAPGEDGSNQDIRVWNLLTSEPETALSDSGYGYWEGSGGRGFDVEFSPDGQTLATLSGQGVRLWDVLTGQLKRTLKVPEQTRVDVRDEVMEQDDPGEVLPFLQLYGVAYSPTEPMVAGLSPYLGVWLWNADTGEVVFSSPRSPVFSGPPFPPSDAVFTQDGSTLIAADGSLLDVSSRTMKRVFTMPTYVLGTDGGYGDYVEESTRHLVSLSPDGSMVIIGGYGSMLLSEFHGKWSLLFAGTTDATHAAAFSPDGLTLAGLTYGGVSLWDMSGFPPNRSATEVTLVDSLGLSLPGVPLYIERSVAGEDFFHWSTRTDDEGRAALAVTKEGYYHFSILSGDNIPRGNPHWRDVPLRAASNLTLRLIVPPRRHLQEERWPLEISGIPSGSTRVGVQIPEDWGPRSVYLARSVSGQHSYYVWQARADSSGYAEFAIHTFGRASGFYRLWCRGQHWHSIPLNQGHSQIVELHEDGTFRMARGFLAAKTVALHSSMATALDPGFPNPFNSETRLTYRLALSCKVDLMVYNSLGQPVRDLASGVQHAGRYQLSWDGRDDQGIPLAAGVYLMRLVHPDGVFTRRLLYLK